MKVTRSFRSFFHAARQCTLPLFLAGCGSAVPLLHDSEPETGPAQDCYNPQKPGLIASTELGKLYEFWFCGNNREPSLVQIINVSSDGPSISENLTIDRANNAIRGTFYTTHDKVTYPSYKLDKDGVDIQGFYTQQPGYPNVGYSAYRHNPRNTPEDNQRLDNYQDTGRQAWAIYNNKCLLHPNPADELRAVFDPNGNQIKVNYRGWSIAASPSSMEGHNGNNIKVYASGDFLKYTLSLSGVNQKVNNLSLYSADYRPLPVDTDFARQLDREVLEKVAAELPKYFDSYNNQPRWPFPGL